MSGRESRNLVISKRVGRKVLSCVPKVSIIIPCYNNAEFIAETLESVASQKFREYETIVVNDGSPDTVELERAMNLRLEDIIYIKQKGSGAGPARNTAIEHARGDVIAFLDGDDIWLPEFLASQTIFMERGGFDMVYSDAYLFGLNSAYMRRFMETAPSEGVADFESILDARCNVITSGTLAKKKTVVDAGMFEIERVRAHDFHLWLRMAKKGAKIGYQREALLKYRVHLDSLSGDSVSRVERERDAYERIRRTIELTDEQNQIVDRRVIRLETDLAVEQGKSYLLSGDFPKAAAAFRSANRIQRSAKLTAIEILTRIAPRTLLKFYLSNRVSEIALVPKQSKG